MVTDPIADLKQSVGVAYSEALKPEKLKTKKEDRLKIRQPESKLMNQYMEFTNKRMLLTQAERFVYAYGALFLAIIANAIMFTFFWWHASFLYKHDKALFSDYVLCFILSYAALHTSFQVFGKNVTKQGNESPTSKEDKFCQQKEP